MYTIFSLEKYIIWIDYLLNTMNLIVGLDYQRVCNMMGVRPTPGQVDMQVDAQTALLRLFGVLYHSYIRYVYIYNIYYKNV
jgi:hypothetical protein